VFSVITYAEEAIIRAVLRLAFAVKDFLEQRGFVGAREEEGEKERPLVPPGYVGFVKVWSEGAMEEQEYRWRGGLDVRIPLPAGVKLSLPAIDLTKERRPARMHFSVMEAASKNWYKDVESLAKLIESQAKKRREGGGAE